MKGWRGFFILLLGVWSILFILSIGLGEEEFLKRGRSEGIPFLSGGVGIRERELLNEMGKGYSLKMVFSNKRGEYLTDIVVRVLDSREKVILTTVSNGPWLFIDLPEGVYALEASFMADRKKIGGVEIKRGVQKVISFQWE